MNIIQPSYKWNGKLTMGNKPQFIVLHHAEAVSCTVADIHQWHQQRGWTGIGYHYFVRKDGSIFKGRPDEAWGAQCPTANEKSIGICVEGSYDGKETVMPEIQRKALVELCKYVNNKFGISKLYRHRDLWSTSCPGKFYPYSQICAEVASGKIVAPIVEKQVNRTWLQVGDEGSKVKDLQEKLNKLGFTCGNADGIYGKLVKNAVYAFQHKYGLQEDGLANTDTLNKLNEVLTVKPTEVGNERVRSIQKVCNKLGIKDSNGKSISEDGIYGPATEFAIKKLPIAKIKDYSNIEYTKWIQTRMGILNDGIFYNATEVAIKAFQQKYNLTADGIVGFNTLKAMLFN